MPFDPDNYLASNSPAAVADAPPSASGFNPDAYLAPTVAPTFDPNAYLEGSAVNTNDSAIRKEIGIPVRSPADIAARKQHMAEAGVVSGDIATPLVGYGDTKGQLATIPKLQEQNPDEHLPMWSNLLVPGLSAIPKDVGAATVNAVGKTVSGLTSPSNVALMAATGGSGALVRRVAAVGFGGLMAKGAYEQGKQTLKLAQDPNATRQAVLESAAETGIGGLLAVASAAHGIRGEAPNATMAPDGRPGLPRAVDEVPPARPSDAVAPAGNVSAAPPALNAPEKIVRLYRGDGPIENESIWSDPRMKDYAGRWFTQDEAAARSFAKNNGGKNNFVSYVDVPASKLADYNAGNVPSELLNGLDPKSTFVVPNDVAELARNQRVDPVAKSPADAVKDYSAVPESNGGKYISSDVARPLVPGFDPANPTATHAAASAIADSAFESGLKNPEVKRVMIMAGGAGSGKSSVKPFIKPDDLVYDGTFASASSLARLDTAVASGKPVEVRYIYRPFGEAVGGMLARRGEKTPVVPADTVANGHFNSLNNFLAAAEKYKGDPNVKFEVVDNSHGKGKARGVENPIAFARELAKKQPSPQELRARAGSHPDVRSLNATERETYLGSGVASENSRGSRSAQQVGNGRKVGGLPPVEIPTGPGVPPYDGAKPLGFVESAKTSPEIAAPLREGLAGYYEPQTNAASYQEARKLLETAGDLQTAKSAFMSEQNPDAVTSAMGLELIRKFQADGKLADAADVIYNLAQKAKTQGQAIQILGTLSRSTPEGMATYAQKIFGRKLTPEEMGKIKTGLGRVNVAIDPSVKLARMAQLMDQLKGRTLGSRWDEKLSGAMNLSMLLNPKTIIRNIGGNVLMAAADLAADTITPAVDSGVKIFTGRRTVGGPQMREYLKGLGEPIRDFKAGYAQARSEGAGRFASFKEGADVLAVLGKLGSGSKTEVGDMMRAYRMTFSNPAMRSLEKGMSILMGSPDRAFYMGKLKASLADQVKVAGAAVPTAEMLDRAALEAARSVYQDKNFISDTLSMARKGLNYGSTFGKSTRFGAGQAIVPFVQVPGSLLMRGLEYSPVGFIKALSETVAPLLPSGRPFNQREFSQAMSKAFVGTAGLAATGYWLSKLGIVTGTPDLDPKVRALQRSLGFGAYSINVSALKRAFVGMDWRTKQRPEVGDTFVNYDWAAPMAFPVAVGASFSELQRHNAMQAGRGKMIDRPSEVLASLLSGARTLEEQPLLTGLSGFANDVSAATRQGSGMLEALANSMAKIPAQYVPAAVRQVQQLMDNRVYETRGTAKMETAYQAAVANVPGLAKALGFKPRFDVLGDVTERYQANGNSFFNVMVNPAFVTHVKGDPELREIYRIWERTGEGKQIPGQVDGKVTVNGQQKELTSLERSDYQQFVGRITRDAFRMLMRAEGYSNAADDQRAKVLGEVTSAAAAVGKLQLFGNRPKSFDKFDRALFGMSLDDPKARALIKTLPVRRQ